MSKRDLFVAVADLDAENAIKTLLCHRQEALGIQLEFNPERTPSGDLFRYNKRDSGCYKDAVNILRPPQRTHQRALLVFDWHGCGAENKGREAVESEVEERLHKNGWGKDRVAAIVIEPELEAWVWARSPNVADILGWEGNQAGLLSFLQESDLWSAKDPKPKEPKTAMRQALRKKRKPLGAPLFAELALKVGVKQCQDPAFQKFRRTLTRWFSE